MKSQIEYIYKQGGQFSSNYTQNRHINYITNFSEYV